MHYSTHEPPPALAPWVRMCWSLSSDNAAEVPHRLMADTSANIVFVRRGSFIEHGCVTMPGVHLAGPLSRHTDMIASPQFDVFGVYLWPWSAEILFGIPPDRQLDAMIDLVPQWSTDEQVPFAAILASNDPDQCMVALVELLHGRIQGRTPDPMLHQLMDTITTAEELPTIEDLVQRSGLARRQFERRFKAITGLSPALFMRIVRFQRSFRMLENGMAGSLTEVAMVAGYFDQSHFIRDFKRFSGMNPRRYFIHTEEKADSFLRME